MDEFLFNIDRNKRERIPADTKHTRRNPDGSFRIPLSEQSEIRISSDRYGCTVYGNVVNALGWWESWNVTAEEAEKIFLQHNKKRNAGL